MDSSGSGLTDSRVCAHEESTGPNDGPQENPLVKLCVLCHCNVMDEVQTRSHILTVCARAHADK